MLASPVIVRKKIQNLSAIGIWFRTSEKSRKSVAVVCGGRNLKIKITGDPTATNLHHTIFPTEEFGPIN
jgi:hypothetical protein